MHTLPFRLSLLSLALIGLTACQSTIDDDGMSASSASANSSSAASAAPADADAYIRANISSLSPEPAVLGGTFHVTEIEWTDADTAVVTYEDGHNQFTADAEVTANGDMIKVTSFVVRPQGRAQAKEGEMCGGIAGIACAGGLTCKYDGDHPDAAGTCVRE